MIRYRNVIGRCFINLPFHWLDRGFLEKFLADRLQPEIGLDGDVLETVSDKEFSRVSRILSAEGLACTLHAPFMDLAPGAFDPTIRRVTREKLGRAMALIPLFKPRSVVCHLNYEDYKYGTKPDLWLGHSVETWQMLLETASRWQTPIMLENTYESTADRHIEVLRRLDSPYARFCLDVGHVNAFARNRWQDWLPALEPWLGQLHLHDNNGFIDEHLAVGCGSVDFAGLFGYLESRSLRPIITLEPHEEESVRESLARLTAMREFRFQLEGGSA